MKDFAAFCRCKIRQYHNFFLGEKFKQALKAALGGTSPSQQSFRMDRSRSTIRNNTHQQPPRKRAQAIEMTRASTLRDQHMTLEIEWE